MKALFLSFIRATARTPLLSSAYRGYYALALRAFVSRMRVLPTVSAVLVSRSGSTNDWLPGYSDLDLVVILGESEPETESRRLIEFAERYRRLRKLFPILRVSYLTTETEYKQWLACGGLLRLEATTWKAIYAKNGDARHYTEIEAHPGSGGGGH